MPVLIKLALLLVLVLTILEATFFKGSDYLPIGGTAFNQLAVILVSTI